MSISIDVAIEIMERQVEQYATPFDFFLRDALKELKDLRAELAEIESQVPVGLVKTIGGYPDESEHGVDWLVKHQQLVDGQDLYARPVPAKQPARITKRDAREIISAYIDSKIGVPVDEWLVPLLKKLNAERTQTNEVVTESELVEALCALRGCIMETRGPIAHSALERADAVIVAYRKQGEWVNDDDA